MKTPHKKTLKFIPSGYTEQTVVDLIDSIVKKIASYFQFGYFDYDDIIQEGRLCALKSLSKYKPNKGSLYCFLNKCIKNGLVNLKRDILFRPTPPCEECRFKQGEKCNLFELIDDCTKYRNWQMINRSKKDIQNKSSHDIERVYNNKDELITNIYNSELLHIIDQHLPIKYREDYLKVLDGCSIKQNRKMQLHKALQELLMEYAPSYYQQYYNQNPQEV